MAIRKTTVGGKHASVTITVDDTQVTLALTNFADRLGDFRRFWREFYAPKFLNDVLENFHTQGGSVGGWRALSPRYAAWKRSVVGNKPILVFSGAMRDSFVIGNKRNVLKVTKASAEIGSSDPKVDKHQLGDGVPVRRVIFIGPARVYKPLLDQFLREEMDASGLKGRRIA
jgi:hypothetical protein